jgi:hypothetical protein
MSCQNALPLLRQAEQRRRLRHWRPGCQCVLSLFCLSIQAIEIGQVGDVAPNAGDIAADFPDGLFQFLLAAARNENVGSFRDKLLRRGEAEAAGSARDKGYFSV